MPLTESERAETMRRVLQDDHIQAIDRLRAAPTLAALDGRWAVPGVGYGMTIAQIAEQLRAA